MEHQTHEFAFFITSQALPHSLSQTGVPEAADTSPHESCAPPDTPAGCAERLMMTGRDDEEWAFISPHLIRWLRRGSLPEFTAFLTLPVPVEVFPLGCWSLTAWDPRDQPGGHLCYAMVMYRRKSRYSRMRHKNKSLQTAIRIWENDWLVFLGLLLENKNSTLQSQRHSPCCWFLRFRQKGPMALGESRPLTQRGSCHGEELVLTCALEPAHLQETAPVAGLIRFISVFLWVKKHCIRSRVSDHFQEAVII